MFVMMFFGSKLRFFRGIDHFFPLIRMEMAHRRVKTLPGVEFEPHEKFLGQNVCPDVFRLEIAIL